MLISIRNKITGWVAWLVVLIIAVPFALFGINAYFEGANEINVAEVNGEPITMQQFQQSAEQRRRFFRSRFGANFDTTMLDTPEARRNIVEELVTNETERAYLQDQGFTLSDAGLQQRILTNPSFQEDGQFSQQAYLRALSGSGYTAEGYEQSLRTAGAGDQLRSGIADSAFVNDSEIDQLLSLSLQQRDADYLLIEAQPLEADVVITDEAVRKEYDDNPEAYQQAERMKVDYLTLSVADIEKDIELDDDELRAVYEGSKGRFTQPETRRASHILFEVKGSASDDERAAIKATAEEVFKEAQGGDFAALALEHSSDVGSSKNGGDLGIITKGQMVEPFEEAVYSMAQDEVRGPIETQFGYHIIKLTELGEERQKPFDEVKEDVRLAEVRRLAASQYTETVETFRTQVFEQSDDLIAAAETLGLEVQTSDWISQDDGALPFDTPAARRAAFDVAVVEDDLNSEVVEIGNDTVLAMHKNTYEEAKLKDFDEIKEQIKQQLVEAGASEMANEQGDTMIAKLEAGEALSETEAAKLQTLAQSRGEIADITQRQIAQSVYAAAAPSVDKPTVGGLALNNGDYAVYRLKSVTQGDAKSASEQQRESVVQQLRQRDGDIAYEMFRGALRGQADVQIFDDVLERGDDYGGGYGEGSYGQ